MISRRALVAGSAAVMASKAVAGPCASGYNQIVVPICRLNDTLPAFGNRPPSPSILLRNQKNVEITNQYFKQLVLPAEFIALQNCTNVLITDCDFDPIPVLQGASRRCIYLVGCSGTLKIQRCRARSVAQSFIQLNQCVMTGSISANLIRGTTLNTVDMIGLVQSGGIDATHRLGIFKNALDGNDPVSGFPGYNSGAGSAIMASGGALDANTGFIDIYDNRILNAAANGISVVGGNDIRVDNNWLFSIQTSSSSIGVSISLAQQAQACQAIEATGNRVNWLNSLGAASGSLNDGTCGTVASWASNNFSDSGITQALLEIIF